MRRIIVFTLVCTVLLTSCDKVENAHPVAESTLLDYTLYPGGDEAAYYDNEWPTFTANTNTLRNVVIEDFTGHKCMYCPLAADEADAIHIDYPTRVFVAAIHTGPTGMEGFQAPNGDYPIDWTNPDGLDIGIHFGSISGSDFDSNPKGTINRIMDGEGQHTLGVLDWRITAESTMLDPLQVKLQSALNYFPSTSGVFLHTEVEVLPGLNTENLYTVVYLIEDSIVGKQLMPNNSPIDDYVHRDVMRDCISSGWKGRQLTEDYLDVNGKYYFDYSFALPSQYNAANMHLLIYVRDSVTDEIYQVIKQKIE